jgi:hypothetical protein
MKTPLIPASLLALLASAQALAQSNTFPASGNVGIGTLNPQVNLQVEGINTAISIRGTGQTSLQLMGLSSSPDRKTSEIIDWNGKITFRTVNDAYTNSHDWMTVFRSNDSYVVDRIALALGDTRIGIGTENPTGKLDVRGRIVLGCMEDYMTNMANTERAIYFYSKGANAELPNMAHTGGRIYSTNVNADIQGYGVDGGWDGQALVLEAGKDWENFVGTEAAFRKWQLTLLGSGNVGINTAQPTHTLTVNGAIRAREVIVDSDWADYVFADDYKLQSLDEVERHIKNTKHLPGIPAAGEVARQGVSLGDMQTLLLSKIEELTLHQIELNKRLNAQDDRLRAQHEKLDRQSRQLDDLRQENAALKSQPRQPEEIKTEPINLTTNEH